MFADKFVSLTNGLIGRSRIAAEMLLIGVAFQETGTLWRVFSIEGDDLGTLSTFIVSETACMLKKCGLKSNAAPQYFRDRHGVVQQNYVTFAHDPRLSSIPEDVVNEMLGRRFRNPVNLI